MESPATIKHIVTTALALSLGVAVTTDATILTFDDATGGLVSPANTNIPEDYGDNVVSTTDLVNDFGYGLGLEGFTPNVTASYGFQADNTAGNVVSFASGYSGLTNVAYDTTNLRINLTGNAVSVQLYGFDLGAFSSPRDLTVVIKDGDDNELYNSGVISVSNTTPTNIDFSSSPLTADTIKISVTGPTTLYAIDNVRFGEIPEPGTMGLLGTGVALLLVKRRTQD